MKFIIGKPIKYIVQLKEPLHKALEDSKLDPRSMVILQFVYPVMKVWKY